MRPALAALAVAARLAPGATDGIDCAPAESCAAAMPNRCLEMTEGRGTRRPNLAETWASRGSPPIGRRAVLARLGAAAALALWPFPPAVRAAARDTIYQRIWDVDQSASGLPAIAMDETGDPARGFVRVDEDGGARSRAPPVRRGAASRRASGAPTICARRCSTTTASIRPSRRTIGPRRRARSSRCSRRSPMPRRWPRRART